MANRNFANSRIYTGHVMPILIDLSIPIAASGAVGTIKGPYVSAVTRLAKGLYQVQLQDNYSGYYIGSYQMISPVTGSALAIDSVSAALSVGQPYQITTLGDASAAQWTALGVPAGVTPAVGVSFVALVTGSGASSTARVKLVAPGSSIDKVELVADPNTSIAPMIANSGAAGAIILIQTLQAQQSGTTTQGTALQYVLADPANGCTLKLSMLLSNSSVLIGGE